MKHLLSISDLSVNEVIELVKTACILKAGKKNSAISLMPLCGKTLGIIMEKPSTRTTVSFAVAAYQMGSMPLIIASSELQRKRGETIADTARTLSRYLNAVVFRAFSHGDIIEFAANSSIPVINALTNTEHPCQALGDILTICEKKGGLKNLSKVKMVYIGDGNNVANSLMLLCAKLSMNAVIITPGGYEPDAKVVFAAKSIAGKTGSIINISNDISDAANADILYTDVWASMGKDDERVKRAKVFKPYQLNKRIVADAAKDCCVMHCLPARRGEEITDEVIDGRNSIVFDQAENRLHIQKAILLKLVKSG